MSSQPVGSPLRGKFLATSAIAVGLFAGVGLVARWNTLERRLVDGEVARREVSALNASLADLRGELDGLQVELAEASSKAETATALRDRLQSAEARMGDIGQTVEAQSQSLTALEKERSSFGPEVLDRQLAAHDQAVQSRVDSFSKLLSEVRSAADQSLQRVDELDRALSSPRDLAGMWHSLVGPVVQLSGDTSVGSGVLLRAPAAAADDGLYHMPLLTAWHVVRDIQGDLSKTDMPVPTTIYLADGSVRHESAQLLRFDATLDAALLELRTPDRIADGARLASKERLANVRIFDAVYAVGCPLGNDPIPTFGEVATVNHLIDGQPYWMINAPTYIGNSGGGIFDSRSHELLGIFSKIYTHGAVRPTIVPHMGLVTPLGRIYDWLEREGFAALLPDGSKLASKGEAGVASAGY
jgi:S1-C subfamily serine protease